MEILFNGISSSSFGIIAQTQEVLRPAHRERPQQLIGSDQVNGLTDTFDSREVRLTLTWGKQSNMTRRQLSRIAAWLTGRGPLVTEYDISSPVGQRLTYNAQITGAIQVAKTDPELNTGTITATFICDPLMVTTSWFNVQSVNGVVNLQTAQLQPIIGTANPLWDQIRIQNHSRITLIDLHVLAGANLVFRRGLGADINTVNSSHVVLATTTFTNIELLGEGVAGTTPVIHVALNIGGTNHQGWLVIQANTQMQNRRTNPTAIQIATLTQTMDNGRTLTTQIAGLDVPSHEYILSPTRGYVIALNQNNFSVTLPNARIVKNGLNSSGAGVPRELRVTGNHSLDVSAWGQARWL